MISSVITPSSSAASAPSSAVVPLPAEHPLNTRTASSLLVEA